MSVASVISGLSGQAKDDAKVLQGLGKDVSDAEKAFDTAVKNNDPAAIAVAQQQLENAAQKLQAKLSVMQTINRIIDRIIQVIGRIGE